MVTPAPLGTAPTREELHQLVRGSLDLGLSRDHLRIKVNHARLVGDPAELHRLALQSAILDAQERRRLADMDRLLPPTVRELWLTLKRDAGTCPGGSQHEWFTMSPGSGVTDLRVVCITCEVDPAMLAWAALEHAPTT